MITEKEMTLGLDWDGYDRVTGWYVSEKLDGCRGYWDGSKLWTRSGKMINAPAAFLSDLPAGIPLDGELWCGRGCFQAASNAVRLAGKHWTNEVRFMVFDAPSVGGSWPWRMAEVAKALRGSRVAAPVAILDTVSNGPHLKKMLLQVLEGGGEGLMLRNPLAEVYRKGRSADLLKVKYWPR